MENQEETKKSGLVTAGFVLGIIGVCTSFIPIINNLSFIMGLLAVIFGIIGLLKKVKNKTIASIVLGIIAIVITINAQQSLSNSIDEAVDTFNNSMGDLDGSNTDEILANNCDVEFGNFELSVDEYNFADSKLPVTVTNKSSETKSFNIQVEAVADDGSRISTDYVYANNLTAGQKQNFTIFTYVSSDNVELMKNATFNIVEISMY